MTERHGPLRATASAVTPLRSPRSPRRDGLVYNGPDDEPPAVHIVKAEAVPLSTANESDESDGLPDESDDDEVVVAAPAPPPRVASPTEEEAVAMVPVEEEAPPPEDLVDVQPTQGDHLMAAKAKRQAQKSAVMIPTLPPSPPSSHDEQNTLAEEFRALKSLVEEQARQMDVQRRYTTAVYNAQEQALAELAELPALREQAANAIASSCSATAKALACEEELSNLKLVVDEQQKRAAAEAAAALAERVASLQLEMEQKTKEMEVRNSELWEENQRLKAALEASVPTIDELQRENVRLLQRVDALESEVSKAQAVSKEDMKEELPEDEPRPTTQPPSPTRSPLRATVPAPTTQPPSPTPTTQPPPSELKGTSTPGAQKGGTGSSSSSDDDSSSDDSSDSSKGK